MISLPLTEKKKTATILIAVFLLVFVLTSLTPLSCDDYTYCFSWADHSRIHSLTQIIPSMAAHRQSTNGRVITHAIVQFILMFPKPLFNLLNALNVLLICLLLLRSTKDLNDGRQSTLVLSFLFFLWVFVPVFGSVWFWLDGAINYSWGITFLLLFLQPYMTAYLDTPRRQTFSFVDLLRILLAFIAGAYSESASPSVLLLALVLILFVWKKQKKFPLFLILYLFFGFLGFLFLLKAPATASRAVTPDISQIGFQIREVLAYTRQYLLIPCCIFAVLLTLALSLHAERKRLILALLIFLTGLVSLLTYCLATYVIPRHMFFPLFFIAFSCFLLLGELFRVGQPLPARLLLGVLTVFFLFSFAEGILDIGVTWHKSVLREQEIRAALDAGETSISLETWQQYTKYATDYYLQTGSDPHVWPNQDIADYYGFEAVFGIPQSD